MADVIPTRMSVYDLNYDHELARRLIISVNGIEQSDVVAYDVDAGLVVRYATDEAGNFIVNRDSDGPATEEARGEVVIVLKPI